MDQLAMSNESTTFRCYYDDGTILTNADVCPNINSNGSPLISSELTLIENVTNQIQWPWFLLILGLIVLTSQNKKG